MGTLPRTPLGGDDVHVVVVDDEPRLVELVTGYLQELGFTTTGCHTGLEALVAGHDPTADVMVLDLMMPGMNGLDVCRTLRREGVDLPILLLTARGAVSERVTGLEAGADDYVVKPFALEELAARIKVLGRRREGVPRVSAGNVVLDVAEQRLRVAGAYVEVPRRPFAMLQELMLNLDKVVSRQQLFDVVYEGEVDIRSNALEVHVSRLRALLADSGATGVEIATVRGRGYRLGTTPA